MSALGSRLSQDALQDAGCALEQIRIRCGDQKGRFTMGPSEEGVPCVTAFRRGGVPMWKTARGRDDGQDQQGGQLADTLSTPVHVEDLTL